MLEVNDANNLHRTVAGLCLIAAPLALLLYPGKVLFTGRLLTFQAWLCCLLRRWCPSLYFLF